MAKNRLLVNHQGDSIQLSWQQGEAAPHFAPAVPFEHPFDTQALKDLRWYLEQYLRYPYGIEPDRAAKIEQKFRDWGQQLFTLVFSRTEEAQEFFQQAIREGLERCEIAIASDNPAVLNLPWELLYSPEHQFLAPLLGGIYRRVGIAHQASVQADIGEIAQDKLNILLVIARPYGEQDVAFRTIARPMLEALKPIRQQVNLKVLRPPSFQEFERELNANKAFYHMVHFDGHGTVNASSQGELVFETLFGTEQKITAERIAQKLADCRVPVFVLNACKSAQEGGEKFSSVAAQLIVSGAKGVVAMAYSVYAEAAKHFIGGLYGELARGVSLAEAVTAARRMVLNQPLRPSPKGNLPLQDWLVPVLYQQEIYTPFTPTVNLKSEIQNLNSKIEMVDLPEEGAYGFIGRDYDILRLERAFRRNHVGLLKGMGGVGKTELVCGFARWLDETQGRTGGIFFTSFEHGAGLSHVVNQMGRVLWDDSFFQLMPEQQQAVVLEYLRNHPCLLIWDNFEPVAGFPTGNEPLLSAEERDNLKQFLKDLRGGKSWVLITSRREEPWLEDCKYKRLYLSGLSGQDIQELAAKILQRVGVERSQLPPEYLDLLKLLGGHPFCLRVVLPRLKTQSPTELIEALRLGLDTFSGAEEEGREKSLTVSLDYSFAKLSERARRHLPFLALFSERVDANWLHAFSGTSDHGDGQAYRAVFGENLQKADWLNLLNEAAEAGILEHSDHVGASIYKVHPALPWYLRQWLSEQHAAQKVSELETKLLVFYTGLADHYREQLISNTHMATKILLIEEPNLLQNLRLAEQQQRWAEAQIILQALGKVYEKLGRKPEFRLLRKQAFSKIGITLAEAKAKGRGVFNFWIYLQGGDAGESLGTTELAEAQKIHQEILNELIMLNDSSMNEQIAIAHHNLGLVAQKKRDSERALNFHKKAIEIYEAAGNFYEAAGIYYNLGMIAQQQRNFEESIKYYKNALKIHQKVGDSYEAVHDYSGLGDVAEQQRDFYKAVNYYEKALNTFKEHQDFHRVAVLCNKLGAATQQLQNYKKAIDYYREAIKFFENAQNEISAAFVYHNLGTLSWMQQEQDFEAAINYYKKAFSIFQKFEYRREASLTLGNWGRVLEAQENCREALKTYIQFWTMNVEYHLEWINGSIKAMGRMLNVLGESQFQAVLREVTGEDCSEEWLSAFRKANEAEE